MNAERFQLVCEIFEAARNAGADTRETVLAQRCDGDDDLRAQVVEMLHHHDGDGPLSEPPRGADEPSPSRVGDFLGGYVLTEQIGEGGMGAVFLADAPDGAQVALKVLHAHLGATGKHHDRFLREARIGGDVDHPGVVRVIDAGIAVGDTRDVPFLVMEYVQGQSLRELMDELGRVPEDLCRHVARELADALAAVHAAGVVHRDVKPDNVLITAEHAVKLTDLGVAHVSDASAVLSRSGMFVGSLTYASPEQFMGTRSGLDGRADLHALGIVLHELTTGDNPFSGGDPAAVMRRVLDVTPPRVGEANPQVSAFFEEVVYTLLAKDRALRFASAAELRDVLDDGEASAWWRERQGAARDGAPARRRVRIPRETAVHGRAAELAALRAAFTRAAVGSGHVALIEGEAGIGKTRLVDELLGTLERENQDVDVLIGGYAPIAASGIPGAVLGALRERFGDEDPEQRIADLLPGAAELGRGLAALLRGDAAGALPRDAIEAAVVRVVQALAARRPVVVVVDDLHFAPAEGRTLFQSLALGVQDHPVLLLGTARPGLPERFTTGLAALAHVERLTLQRLGARDLGRLLVEAFRSERLADELGWQLARKSDGNPFFVFEIVRGLKEAGQLHRGPDGTWSTTGIIADIEVPSSVTDLIESRIAAVPDEEQEILDVAACCGFEFEPALVAEALERSRIPVLRALGRIERHHGLVYASGPRFVFDHHQVQETLYERLSPALRAEYHAVLGAAQERRILARLSSADDVRGADAAQLAGHFLRAGSVERAGAYLDRAIDHVQARSKDEAYTLCRLALDAEGELDPTTRLAVLLRASDSVEQLGRLQEHEQVLEEALLLADELGDRAAHTEFLSRKGWMYVHSGRAKLAEPFLAVALAQARQIVDRRLECTVLGHLGAAASEQSRFDIAREYQQAALDIARELGDPVLEATAVGGLGNSAWSSGEFDAARGYDERALELATQTGDRRREAVAIGNLGTMYTSLGQYDKSLELQRRRLQISREIGFRRGEGLASGNLGIAMEILGRPEESLELSQRQLALYREVGHRRGEAQAGLCIAIALLAQERYAESRETAERARSIAEETNAPRLVGTCEQLMGDISLASGDADGAHRHFAAARRIAEEADAPNEFVVSALLDAVHGANDTEGAIALFEAHRDRLPFRIRMCAEHLMYSLTGDGAHLDEAWRRLMHLRDHAPEEFRESILSGNASHRALVDDYRAAHPDGTSPELD